MGAQFDYRSYEVRDFDQAKKEFYADVREDQHLHGVEYSGGIGMKDGVEKIAKVFDNEREALDYIEENNSKWEPASAVRYLNGGKMTASSEKKVYKLNVEIDKAREKLEALKLKFKTEIKNAKSKFRACKKCESKVNRDYVRDAQCPVCRNTLFSPTQIKRIEVLKANVQKAQTKREAYKPKHVGGKKEHWIIGGWCSS